LAGNEIDGDVVRRHAVIRNAAYRNMYGWSRSAYRSFGLSDTQCGFRVHLVGCARAGQSLARGEWPKSVVAGEAAAAAITKRSGVRDLQDPASGEGRVFLATAAGRSPAAGLGEGAVADLSFAVVGRLDSPQTCGHRSLDFRAFTGLTHLCLWGLDDLEEITGLPESLERLDLRECTKLRSIPGVKLPKLETLDLGGCVGLPGLPEGLAAPALRWLHLDGCTGIEDGPKTTHAVNSLLRAAALLEELTLVDCEWLGSLLLADQSKNPYVASIGDPRFPERHLKKLVLRGCRALAKLPDLGGYPWLHHLDLRGCAKLKAMPVLPVGERDGRPIGVRTLYATGCDEMRTFRGLDVRRVHRQGDCTISQMLTRTFSR